MAPRGSKWSRLIANDLFYGTALEGSEATSRMRVKRRTGPKSANDFEPIFESGALVVPGIEVLLVLTGTSCFGKPFVKPTE